STAETPTTAARIATSIARSLTDSEACGHASITPLMPTTAIATQTMTVQRPSIFIYRSSSGAWAHRLLIHTPHDHPHHQARRRHSRRRPSGLGSAGSLGRPRRVRHAPRLYPSQAGAAGRAGGRLALLGGPGH